jgi:hypothetical protein
VKRSGRDESIQVVTHLCMEAMLGISLYSYPYVNQQKHFVFLINAYVFSSTKLEKITEQVLPGSERKVGVRERGQGTGEEMAQTMYAHMNKLI